jgi:hypothetical protein
MLSIHQCDQAQNRQYETNAWMLIVLGCKMVLSRDVLFHELKVLCQTLDYLWTLYQELAAFRPSGLWWVQGLRIVDTDSEESDV